MGKEETVSFIIEKVAPIFNKQGYVGTSLSDLTIATGLTKGAIYCNFKNKEDLALNAFKFNARLVLLPLKESIDLASTGFEKLLAVITYHRSYWAKLKNAGGCPILNVGIDSKFINPKLFNMAKKVSERMMDDLVQIIELGKKDKSIKDDVNTVLHSKNIYSMIEGGIFMTMTHEDEIYLQNILDIIELDILPKIRN